MADDPRTSMLDQMQAWAEPRFRPENVTRDGGQVVIRQGSARLFLVPVVISETAPRLIRMTSLVVRRPNVTFDLLKLLLEENSGQLFGRFCLSEAGDVQLEYCMQAHCTEQEFLFVVLSMLDDANSLDDEIVRQWGGQTFEDWVRPVEEAGIRTRVSRLFRRSE